MTATDIDDPFASASTPDDDPFATPDDVKTGAFVPTPSLEALEGRLVAMIPRSFVTDAPIPKEWQQPNGPTTRERFTVDMAVLSGGTATGPLSFEYPGPLRNDGTRELLTETITEFPKLYTDVWRVESSVIGQLKRVDGTSRPILLGVVRRGPKAADRKAGKTFEDIEAAFAAWRRNPKPNGVPAFSWQIDVNYTESQKAIATRWLRDARANGFIL